MRKKIDVASFSETYETDGVDISDGSYTLAFDQDQAAYLNTLDSKKRESRAVLASIFMIVITLMGFPSRANTHLDLPFTTLFIMSLKQFGKNLIGGWDSDPNISKEKKIWQWISLPIKIGIILPWKLITYPFKFLINGAKILTEWIPSWVATWIAAALGAYRRTRFGSLDFPDSSEWKTDASKALLGTFLVGLFKLPHLILGTLYFAFRLTALIGRTITSPLKSARMAFRFGRELKVSVFGESKWGEFFNRLTSNFIGVLGLLISMSLTTLFWIIMLPGAVVSTIGYFQTYYPWIFQVIAWISQLPPVVAAVTWLTNLPLFTAALGLANSFIAPLGVALTQVFGSATIGFAAFVGVPLSTASAITGSALALIASFVAPLLTLVGEVLSNLWATWTNGGPVTAILNCFGPKSSSEHNPAHETPATESKNQELSVNQAYTTLHEEREEADNDVELADTHAQNVAAAVEEEAPYQRSQEGKMQPAPDFAELYKLEHLEQQTYVSV